jgi:hypothetical protein
VSRQELAKQSCELGYTQQDLASILADRVVEFDKWMFGQTVAICESHGSVVYSWDLGRFLEGRPIVD